MVKGASLPLMWRPASAICSTCWENVDLNGFEWALIGECQTSSSWTFFWVTSIWLQILFRLVWDSLRLPFRVHAILVKVLNCSLIWDRRCLSEIILLETSLPIERRSSWQVRMASLWFFTKKIAASWVNTNPFSIAANSFSSFSRTNGRPQVRGSN